MPIHNNYAEDNGRLTELERRTVDDTIITFMSWCKDRNIPCKGDDHIERVAEVLATCIVDSREKAHA